MTRPRASTPTGHATAGHDSSLVSFLRESNHIEGIERPPTREEYDTARSFLKLDEIAVADVEILVETFQPGARIRDRPGMDMRVGSHIAPPGGPQIKWRLNNLLQYMLKHSPYKTHHHYEELHPFTDGNGRSGRMIWLWMMQKLNKPVAPMGFLQTWYYQSLEAGR